MRPLTIILFAAIAVGAIAPSAGAAPRSYIDSLPSCAGTGDVVPLKPANCKQAGGGWKVGMMHDFTADEYRFGSITCPANYPISLASRDDKSLLEMSSRDINATESNYYISEVDNTSWSQRTNRYSVIAGGTSSVAVGATGNWSTEGGGHHNNNPWTMWVICHSPGEFGA
jgi:hypothetical protein